MRRREARVCGCGQPGCPSPHRPAQPCPDCGITGGHMADCRMAGAGGPHTLPQDTGTPGRRRRGCGVPVLAAAVLGLVVGLVLALAGVVVRVDTFHVLGISAGWSDTNYCSAELQSLHLRLSCQSGH